MKNKIKNKKKRLIATGLIMGSIGLGLFGHKDREYNPIFSINYECHNNLEPFASYRSGNVYIVSDSDLKSVKTIVKPNDIIVIDRRDADNPDMVVYNSSLIWDKDIIDDVLNILLTYEEMYPSNWNRSIESLRNEWICHNIAYKLGYDRDDTLSADLDNEESIYFDHKVLTKILRN